MPRMKQILFPVDFSDPCARMAGAVAGVTEHFNARLTLLNAVNIPIPPGMTFSGHLHTIMREEIRKESSIAMDRFVARYFPPSCVLNRVIEEGDPSQVIVGYAHRHKVDLIMMPTHGYGAIRRFLIGSVTGKVLHDALCPVWTSAHRERTRPGTPGAYRKILCAVDADSGAVRLIRWAGWLGRHYRAAVKLVHVIPALNETSRNRGEVELRQFLVRSARARFAAIIDQAGFRDELLLRGGNIPARLAETVEEQHSQLLIVGRGHTQKALGRLRTHSLAIIRESPCPVISV